MVVLANEGYVIVNINYDLAPHAKYPAPLIQVGEAYTYIISNLASYPYINSDELYFGGDSAGAHIASLFVNIQTNSAYVTRLQKETATKSIEKVVDKPIKGALLFAGPYDFDALTNLVESRMSRTGKRNSNTLQSLIFFFAKRIGLAYLGDLNWKGQAQYEVLSVTDYVSSAFPRPFLTDGRTFSFEDHARK